MSKSFFVFKAVLFALLGLAALSRADDEPLIPGGDVYVSERANIWTRSGPGENYRITGSRHVGDQLTFVRYSDNGRFVLVEDGEGQHWMQTLDIQAEPCGKAMVAILQRRSDELESKLANYDSELARQLSEAQAKITELERENGELKASGEEKDASIQQLQAQEREYAYKLETRELDMQMRWWLQGALIALGGAIIGIVFVFIPRPARRQQRKRF